ncbi:MAG: hypothetical protein FJ000_05690, partial [Actinobacteria bacterium]|nr:hypothetical protein [Actinomycetota bacterium]
MSAAEPRPAPLQLGGEPFPGTPPQPPSFLCPGQLATPLTSVARVGPAIARRLGEIGLATIGDLLEHYPRRYDDYRDRRDLGSLKIGEEATVRATVERVVLTKGRRKGLQVVRARVRDPSGVTEAIWFNQAWLAEALEPGMTLSLRGTLTARGGRPSFVVKSHEILAESEETLHTEGVVPVYPAGEAVSARLLRTLVRAVLPAARGLPDPLPAWLRVEHDLPTRADAVLAVHAPREPDVGRAARARLVFEESYLLQVGLLAHKAREQGRLAALPLIDGSGAATAFEQRLPFTLTAGQKAAVAEIDADVATTRPMRRLLQ